MKLVYCPNCHDMRKLHYRRTYCQRRQSWGQYADSVNATYGGKATPFGIDNKTLLAAILCDQKYVACFRISVPCDTFGRAG